MAGPLSSETIHATCVAISGRAVLLSGPSGSGKSDLALRLVDRGAALVSDDYTIISRDAGRAFARAPETIRGKIEVRGLGIIEMESVQNMPVAAIFDFSEAFDRLPESTATRAIAGVEIPLFGLKAFEASAPIKVELTLASLEAHAQ